MAWPNTRLIQALRETASRLEAGIYYAWGHHGGCNCGNLLQVLTYCSKEEIQAYAQTGTGEWSELAEDHCKTTGLPAGLLVSKLQEAGLTTGDIHHLEYLDDREVLERLPGGFRWLRKNVREDVILYFNTFANLLAERLPEQRLKKTPSRATPALLCLSY